MKISRYSTDHFTVDLQSPMSKPLMPGAPYLNSHLLTQTPVPVADDIDDAALCDDGDIIAASLHRPRNQPLGDEGPNPITEITRLIYVYIGYNEGTQIFFTWFQ